MFRSVSVAALAIPLAVPAFGQTYPVVDTGQDRCYDGRGEIECPQPGEPFFGQDAQYAGKRAAYRVEEDGTVTDLVTHLTWLRDPGEKQTWAEAVAGAERCRVGGHDDWRLPTVKELYSLIRFDGLDPDPRSASPDDLRPFLDTEAFAFRYGDPSDGDRLIDSQWATSTRYVGRVMHGQEAMYGVNFADGRIKGYPTGRDPRGRTKTFYVLYVRGNPDYGKNDFVDNEDGTITDRATGLTWMKADSAALNAGPREDGTLDWGEALDWAETLEYAGHDDWRLPNAKELHTIVDYSRAPDVTDSAAIDPVFTATPIENEGGERDYGQYWTSTSHLRAASARAAVYIAFGRALGFMGRPGDRSDRRELLDVHGAGAQRSDDKVGDPSRFPRGRGPQGDVVRIHNLARCVRGGAAERAKPADDGTEHGR